MNTQEFLQSTLQSQWISEDGLEIYVRKSKRYIGDRLVQCFDIANVTAKTYGQGNFTAYLSKLVGLLQGQPFEAIYIENVINDRFVQYLVDKEFKRASNDSPLFAPSLYKYLNGQ